MRVRELTHGAKFLEDKQGNIIAGTADSGLYRFKNDIWEIFKPAISVSIR